jgi:hypothetical protein
MKKLYEFNWDCGRMGDLNGLFIAEEGDINNLIGEEIYFGEVLGKHSEIHGVLEEKELTVKSEDQDFISKLEDLLGSTISGYNPVDYYEPEEEEDDDE